MKKLLTLLCGLPLFVTAQNFHFGTRIGFAGYQGDLKPASKPLSQLKLMGSFGSQYDLSEHLSARGYFSYLTLQGDDRKGDAWRQQRNLNFKTRVLDFELGAQLNLFSLNEKWWTPYAFAGLGLYRYNPYTTAGGEEKIYLPSLGTEGQGIVPGVEPYRLTQFSVPFGLGAHYTLGEDARIGLEGGYRKLFNDYLDDVSGTYADAETLRQGRGQQAVDLAWRGDEVTGLPYPAAGTARGGPAKDGYYYVAVTFTLRWWFDKYKQVAGIPGGSREKRVGCPSATRAF